MFAPHGLLYKNSQDYRIVIEAYTLLGIPLLKIFSCCNGSVSCRRSGDKRIHDPYSSRHRGAVIEPQRTNFSQANIGYGHAISDTEVIELLERYNIKPHVVFMKTVGGLSGSHRFDNEKEFATQIGEARVTAVETFEMSLEDTLVRLKRSASMYTEEEVAANEGLQNIARSFLNFRPVFEASLAEAKQAKPLIYSVEVAGVPISIEQLSNDKKLKTFQPAIEEDGEIAVPRPVMPNPFQVDYLDPNVEGMSAKELYQRIQALGGGSSRLIHNYGILRRQ